MDKEKILKILLNNIDCFSNISEIDFYLLVIIDTSELGLINDNVIKLTPLLKQITEYALVNIVLDDEQLERIEHCFDKNNSIFKESLDLIVACYEYIITLIDENCNHPSILSFDTLNKELNLYIEFNEILNDIIELTDGFFQDDLINLGCNIDEKIFDIIDNNFDNLLNRISNGIINNKQGLILSLTNFSKSILNIIMSISKNSTIYNVDDNYVYIAGNERIASNSNITALNFLNCFISIIERVDEYRIENYDEDITLLIDELKEIYHLYKSYKFQYLKHDYREQKILEKVKKCK